MLPGRSSAAALPQLHSQPKAAKRRMRMTAVEEKKRTKDAGETGGSNKVFAELLFMNLQHPHKSFSSCAVIQNLLLRCIWRCQEYCCTHLDTAGILTVQAVTEVLCVPCSLYERCLQGRWGWLWRGWCRGADGLWFLGFEWSGSTQKSGCRWRDRSVKGTDPPKWSAAAQTCAVGRKEDVCGWEKQSYLTYDYDLQYEQMVSSSTRVLTFISWSAMRTAKLLRWLQEQTV